MIDILCSGLILVIILAIGLAVIKVYPNPIVKFIVFLVLIVCFVFFTFDLIVSLLTLGGG